MENYKLEPYPVKRLERAPVSPRDQPIIKLMHRPRSMIGSYGRTLKKNYKTHKRTSVGVL